jgi:O-antigen/teichoic acid export membrane protein
MLFMQICTNLFTAVLSKKKYPQYKASGKLPKEFTKEINRRIRDLFTAKLGTTIVNSADTIVISTFLGLTVLAIYQNYYLIMISIIGIITILLGSCTAGIGHGLITETLEKNYEDFKKFFYMEVWVAGICVCCLLNMYQPFMILWMGENNLLSSECVILLCLYFYLYVLNHFMAMYKDAAGMWHEDRFRPLVAALTNLALNLILVQFIGLYGILISTVLAIVCVGMPWLLHNLFTVIFEKKYLVG